MTTLQRAIDCVVGPHSIASLYKDYRRIETEVRLRKDYDRCIQQDIPRTFPKSSFLKRNGEAFQRLLSAYVVYSPVGYVQGINFLAAASLYFFSAKTMYLSFWLMVALFENVKHIFLLQIDETFLQQNKIFDASVEKVTSTFLSYYRAKHPSVQVSETVLLGLKNLVQWKVMGTLLLSCSGNTLVNSKRILFYFLPFLHNVDMFRKKLSAVALSFLFCCLMEKELSDEVILVLQSANLNENGLMEVLKTASETEKLL